MVVQGTPIARRPEAETRLKTILAGMLDGGDAPDAPPVVIARLGEFDISATVRRRLSELPGLTVTLEGVPESELRLTAAQLAETALVARLENRLTGLERLRDETVGKMERLRGEVGRARDLLGEPLSPAAEPAPEPVSRHEHPSERPAGPRLPSNRRSRRSGRPDQNA